MTPPLVTFDNVSMGYLPGRMVLKDVSFSLPKGSFHFLAGASGAGKTSLLKLLSITQRPTRGSIRMFDRVVSDAEREELPSLRRKVGMVFQDFRLLEHLSVAENIALPLKIAGEPQDDINAKVDELLAWIELSEFRDVRPELLSGGQKQRVAIARAVVANPDLLLADEPSGNLDPALSVKFMYLFEALHKLGTTIVLATHQENLLSQFKYPVLRLQDGRLDITRKAA